MQIPNATRFGAMRQIGEAYVTSGTLMVIDPAYASSWNTGEHPDLTDEGRRRAWEEGRNQLYFANGKTAAVFIKGFGGDGTYPVLIEDRRGQVGQSIGSFAVDLMAEQLPPALDPLAANVVARTERSRSAPSAEPQ
jgi:hypothetical protein